MVKKSRLSLESLDMCLCCHACQGLPKYLIFHKMCIVSSGSNGSNKAHQDVFRLM